MSCIGLETAMCQTEELDRTNTILQMLEDKKIPLHLVELMFDSLRVGGVEPNGALLLVVGRSVYLRSCSIVQLTIFKLGSSLSQEKQKVSTLNAFAW
jgi:hypothetical protein